MMTVPSFFLGESLGCVPFWAIYYDGVFFLSFDPGATLFFFFFLADMGTAKTLFFPLSSGVQHSEYFFSLLPREVDTAEVFFLFRPSPMALIFFCPPDSGHDPAFFFFFPPERSLPRRFTLKHGLLPLAPAAAFFSSYRRGRDDFFFLLRDDLLPPAPLFFEASRLLFWSG